MVYWHITCVILTIFLHLKCFKVLITTSSYDFVMNLPAYIFQIHCKEAGQITSATDNAKTLLFCGNLKYHPIYGEHQ